MTVVEFTWWIPAFAGMTEEFSGLPQLEYEIRNDSLYTWQKSEMVIEYRYSQIEIFF